jgi:hypothetical protein
MKPNNFDFSNWKSVGFLFLVFYYVLKILETSLEKSEGQKWLSHIVTKMSLPIWLELDLPIQALDRKPRFKGLSTIYKEDQKSEIQIVKEVVYRVFKTSRAYGLTNSGSRMILYSTAYSEKAVTENEFFFNSVRDSIKAIYYTNQGLIQDDHELLEDFNEMLKSYEPMCSYFLFGKTAYLLMLTSGAIYGGIFYRQFYREGIAIAYKLTIGHEESFAESKSGLVRRFVNLVKFLLPTKDLRDNFDSNLNKYILHNYQTTLRDDPKIDWQKVVCNTLIDLIFQTEEVSNEG